MNIARFPNTYDNLPHEGFFQIMGETIRYATNHPRVLELCDTLMPRLVSHQLASIDVRVVVNKTTSQTPFLPRYTMHNNLFLGTFNEENYFSMDLEKRFAVVCINQDLLHESLLLRLDLLLTLALASLPVWGYLCVHATCVSFQGRNALICAPSGVGKSTLTYACLKRGFQLVSEDAVFVNTQPELRFYGTGRWLRLLEDVKGFFPELLPLQAKRFGNGKTKIELEVGAFFPNATQAFARPDMLFFLERTGVAPQVRRLSHTEAQDRFEIIHPYQTQPDVKALAQLEAWVGNNAHVLQSAKTPQATAVLLEQALKGKLP
jgi:hypothetical protein